MRKKLKEEKEGLEAQALKAEIYDLSKELRAYKEVLTTINEKLGLPTAPVDIKNLYEKIDTLIAKEKPAE